MRNLLPRASIKIACLLWIAFVFNEYLYGEKYLFQFSEQFHYLLDLQKRIFSQTHPLLCDSQKRKFFNVKLSQDVSYFSDYELIGLTFAYLDAQGKEFPISENEIEPIKNTFEKYLQQILYNDTQLSQELNCKRVGDECPVCLLIDRFLSFFEGKEEFPTEVAGEFLYKQPSRKLSSPF